MAIYKNPFLTRFSDRTGLKSSVFLSMYAHQIITELLKIEELLSPKASWIIGIPGSGKSSILRLFSAEILHEIIKQKSTYMQLYATLEDAKIVENDTVNLVGIYLQIDELYSEAANVDLGGVDNTKLFYTLFDLRVARQLISTFEILFGVGNENKIYAVNSGNYPPVIFSNTYNCVEFDKIIKEKEQLIASVLTSFPGTPIPEGLELHNRLSCLDFIDAQHGINNIKYILMIDDVHELYKEQFNHLKEAVERRRSFPRWVASRKHIFPINHLIGDSDGIITGREIKVIDIDKDIYSSKSLYNKFIKKLVEKRLKLTSTLHEYNSDQIDAILKEYVFSSDADSSLIKQNIINEINNVCNNIGCKSLNDLALMDDENSLIDLSVKLIKVYRLQNKKQKTLFPQLEIDSDDSKYKDRLAAELFVKRKLRLPQYSGFNTIIESSNNNIEQFLRVFSPFVDRLIYRVEMDKQLDIDPEEQNRIFKAVSKEYTTNVISKLLYGKKILQLVENLGNFFAYRTYEPNAPYAPGVTQFALTATDLDLLEYGSKEPSNVWIENLTRILTIAISNNIIVPEGSQNQGTRGSEKKHIFSLNRLLCIKYELPLQKGSFQRISLTLLNELCNKPIKPEEILSNRMLSPQNQLWNSDNA